jgi:hypothetical protein
MVVGKRGRHGLEQRSEWRVAHLVSLLGGGAHQHHQQRHGITMAARCEQRPKVARIVLPGLPGSRIVVVRRLVHGKLRDLAEKLDCRFHRQDCAS